MKKLKTILSISTALFFLLLFFRCQTEMYSKALTFGKPVVDSSVALKSSESFFKNYYPFLNLDEEFIPLNQSNNFLNKSSFFDSLQTGFFLPLKQVSKENIYYRLIKIDKDVDESIISTIKVLAYGAYNNLKLEGTKMPDFNFKDLNNNLYTNESTKGKIVVIKCWFIQCQRCVEEFPLLNSLVEKYNNNKDIVFVSLAFDKESELIEFLKVRKFKYEVVAKQKEFMTKKLGIQSFPTHIIINKEGKIEKVKGEAKNIENCLIPLL